jgi:hypothetical protein
MEYGYNYTIFGQNMMMKSGLEKIFLKSHSVQRLFQDIFFTSKMTFFAHGGISKKLFWWM